MSNGQPVPYGYNVIGDGVYFWLVRTSYQLQVPHVVVKVSRCFDVRVDADAKAFFQHCVAMARQAYVRRDTYVIDTVMANEAFKLGAILDCNDHSVIFRYTTSAAPADKRICKITSQLRDDSRIQAEKNVWTTHGEKLRRCETIVQYKGAFFDIENSLVFHDDGGLVLEDCCRCSRDKCIALFDIVLRDVRAAFAVLHADDVVK